MKTFKISILPIGERTCRVSVEEYRNNRWALFDVFEADSQLVSEMLVYERQKASQGMFILEVDDRREKFMMC